MSVGMKSASLLLPMLLSSGFGSCLWAETSAACNVPPELVTTGGSASFVALSSEGAWFAQKHLWHCAEDALSKAARLSPDSWKTLYDLGVVEVNEQAYLAAIPNLSRASALKPDSNTVRRALAEATRSSGDLPGAEVQFRRLVELDPQSVQALDDLATVLATEKLYAAAIRYWDQALIIEPDNVDIAISRAEALNTHGATAEAIKSLQKLETKHPSVAGIHFSLGTVFGLQKRFEEGASEFRKALQLDPHDSPARLSLARCLVSQGEYTDVLPLLIPFVKSHPSNADAHSLLGFAYRGLEKYELAEQQLRIAAISRPDDGDIQLALGVALMHIGQQKEAVSHLQRAIDLEPSAEAPRLQMALALKALNDQVNSQAMYQQVRQTQHTNLVENQFATIGKRANELLSTGHADKAEALYREMLQMTPNDAHTYYNLGLALGMQNRKSEETEAFEAAVKLDPHFALARCALGSKYLSEGRLDDALLQLTKSLELDPQISEAQVNLAAIYERQGRIADAEALLRRAVDGNPNEATLHLGLGQLLAENAKFAEAQFEVQRAITLDPKSTDALTVLAKIVAREGKVEESINLFRRVLTEDPQNYLSHLNLGIALADHLEIDSALEQFREAVKLNPKSATSHYNLGRLLLDERKSADAIPELQAACQLDPSLSDGFYLLAVAERQSEEINRSLELVQRSIQLAPEQPKALYLLGQDLLSMSREDEAIAAWKRAEQMDPKSTEVLYKLSQILREKEPSEAAKYASLLKARLAEMQATSEADTMGNLALAAAERHDYAQAIEQLGKALQVCGDCKEKGTLKKDLGLVEARSGNVNAAAITLREAATLSPSDNDINTALVIVTRQLAEQK
jgi:tetratricopeptide (TPR) repeat protein